MPNAKCEKCNLYIDDICINEKHYCRLIKLLKERVKKCFGIPYNITPGIRHNEIIKNTSWKCLNKIECDGVLYYEQFASNPTKYDFDILKEI